MPQNFLVITKDAGFVHESFRNETNRIFWDFWSYETNPRNESFEHRKDSRILNFRLKYVYVVKIRGDSLDSLDSWKKAESCQKLSTKRIHDTGIWKLWSRIETNLFKSGFVIHDTVRIHVFTNLLYESRNLTNYNSVFVAWLQSWFFSRTILVLLILIYV